MHRDSDAAAAASAAQYPHWRQRLAMLLGPWVLETDGRSLRADANAGLLGAVLVLPQAVAFAALAGLPPAMGLATAVWPCIVAALAGSSRLVLTGPTNATALALGAMLLPLAAGDATQMVVLAAALTLLVGLMQTGLALARLGALANFISPAVMLGFTSGAALLIAWYGLGGLLGGSGRVGALQAWQQGLSWPSLAVGGTTLALAVLGRRYWRRGPHLLAALVVGGALGWLLVRLGHVGNTPNHPHPLLLLGSTPSAWGSWRWPVIDVATLPTLLPMALALTIIALGQSLSMAKLLAARTGQPLDANRECLGQGLANLGGAFASCMVACGSLNRSIPNLEAGARTPLAGVAASIFVLLLVVLAGPLLAWIPLAGVSALLLVAAWSLIEHAQWRRLVRLDRIEFGIAAATLAATLALRLEVAVMAGVIMSLVAYLYRTAKPALRNMGFNRQGAHRPFVVLGDAPGALPECPQLKMLRMEGSIWFGAVPHVADHLRSLREPPGSPRHLLVMAKSMNFIDLAGADLWEDERMRRQAGGGNLWFHRPRPQVLDTWQATGFLQRLGDGHVFPDKRRAIAHIVPLLDAEICRHCSVRLFEECDQQPGAPLSPMI